MKKFGVLWDLDGTITDSFDCFFAGLLDFMKAQGIPFDMERKAYKAAYFGRTIETVLVDFSPVALGPERLRELGVVYTDLCAEMAKEPGAITMLPGADRVIRELHREAIPQAIGSSSVLKMIQGELGSIGLWEFFDNAVSGSLLPSKPAPDVFLVAAASLGLAPENCVVFEDSAAGVEAAKAAGCRCVAITTTKKREELSKADWIIDGYDEVTLEKIVSLFAD